MAGGDTGNGATLVLATTGAVGDVVSMTLPEWAIEDIDVSHLGSTNFKEYVPGDLAEPGEISATVIFNTLTAVPSLGVAETVTVTFPIGSQTPTNTTQATLAGTGYIKTYQHPELANETLQTASVTVKFDGKTEPAYTVESA